MTSSLLRHSDFLTCRSSVEKFALSAAFAAPIAAAAALAAAAAAAQSDPGEGP